jgi:dipeptide/tripeptide permease
MISGYVIDKILGCRLAVILFNILMTIGQLIFAFGAYHDKIIVMQIGRVIFGYVFLYAKKKTKP